MNGRMSFPDVWPRYIAVVKVVAAVEAVTGAEG